MTIQSSSHNHYNKLFIALRYWLIGKSHSDKSFEVALRALEFAKKYHIGVRKDGQTPEFQHQIEIAHYLRTLIDSIEYPAETLATVFLHDCPEDYNVSFEEIESLFGKRVSESTYLLTKTYLGQKRDEVTLFEEMTKSPISSIVKGADRIHNHQSMHGAFSLEKQKKYIEETKRLIIPMLKKARHIHITQECVYENIKFVLSSQISFIEQKIEISNLNLL